MENFTSGNIYLISELLAAQKQSCHQGKVALSVAVRHDGHLVAADESRHVPGASAWKLNPHAASLPVGRDG